MVLFLKLWAPSVGAMDLVPGQGTIPHAMWYSQNVCVCVCVCVYKRLGSIQGQENAIVCFVIIPIFDFTENNLP